MYFVGIDIAKKTHQAAIICSDGKLIGKPFKFPNTVDGFNLFLEKLTAVNTDLSQERNRYGSDRSLLAKPVYMAFRQGLSPSCH